MGADARFFERLGPLSAERLAALSGASLSGSAAAQALDVSTPDAAAPGEVFFLASGAALPERVETGSIAVTSSQDAAEALIVAGAAAAIVSADPRAAFGRICGALLRPRPSFGSDFVHPTARLAETVRLGPGACIGPGAVIGDHVEIGAGAVISAGVVIGESTRIGPRAVISCALVGARCEIAAGAVVGEADFGLAHDADGLFSMPHVGRVVIEDDVTLGANTTVDRGMIRDTRLGRGCRIDNLCHVAHNVDVGEFVVMAAFAGVSGSVTIGDGAQFGGRAGVADHVTIGKGARLAAFAGVMRDIPAGETWAGSPAQPIQRFMRETVWLRRESGRKAKSGRDKGGA